jgi:outer membrane protein assembly factor BamB
MRRAAGTTLRRLAAGGIVAAIVCLLTSGGAWAEPFLKSGYRVELATQEFLGYGPLELASPAAAPDGLHIVVGTRAGTLVLLRADSGAAVYERKLGVGVSAAPRFDGNSMFVPSDDGDLFRMRICDGRQEWENRPRVRGAIRSTPVLWKDLVFTLDDSSVITAINAGTGEVVLEFADNSFARMGGTPFTVFGYPSLAVEGDALYAGFETGHLIRFRLEGEAANFPQFQKEWTAPLCSPGSIAEANSLGEVPLCTARRTFRDVDSSPTLTAHGLVAGCHCRGLFLLDPETGTLRWRAGIKGPSSPALLGDVLFVAGADGKVYSVNIETGKVVWAAEIGPVSVPARPAVLATGMAGDSAALVVTTGETIYILDAGSGEIQMRLTSLWGTSAAPAVIGQSLFLLTNLGYLYRFDYFR